MQLMTLDGHIHTVDPIFMFFTLESSIALLPDGIRASFLDILVKY